ncbi:MAG: FG-GAP repeat domain-containing protein, partial [Candidatus Methylomirabilales bacterium]
ERDVNGDGKPDILRYYNGTGRLTRQEEDSRLTGRVDTWTFYEDGRPVRKESDTNGDGKVDFWAFYDSSGDVVRTEADTDHDGHRDRVTLYAKGEVTQEQHYSPGLDPARAIITYAGGQPPRKEEDTDGDGRMDRLTEYDGSGRVTKVSRNPVKAGSYALVAHYQPKTGEILREEEDLNGDGRIDIISYYQQGRLIRREFFDLPEVAALTRQLSASPMLLPQEAP